MNVSLFSELCQQVYLSALGTRLYYGSHVPVSRFVTRSLSSSSYWSLLKLNLECTTISVGSRHALSRSGAAFIHVGLSYRYRSDCSTGEKLW